MLRWFRPFTGAARRASRSLNLGIEVLEDRVTPSLGGEFQVNTNFPFDQYNPVVAVAANGRKVVVWHSATDANFNNVDIRAQIYDENNQKFGSELIIADTSDREFDPAVAVDAVGDFVVTWTSNVGNSGQNDIHYALFGNAGNPVKTGPVADASEFDEFTSSVASDAAGNFVVSYTGAPDDEAGVFAARFDADGNRLGDTITVSARSGQYEDQSEVTCAANGRFAIVLNRGSSQILLKRYSASGNLQGAHILTSTKVNGYSTPDVAMYSNGACLAVWEWDTTPTGALKPADVFVERVSRTGVMGPLLKVLKTSVDENDPNVAVDNATGNYVVAMTQWNSATGINSALVLERTQQHVTLGNFGAVNSSDIDVGGFDDDGFYLLVYEVPNSINRGDGDGTGVFLQLGSIHGIPT